MKAPFNRHTGLMVLDVTMSNPNGDPDMESEPRTRESDGLGMISPVSFKRKCRDLVGDMSEVLLESGLDLDTKKVNNLMLSDDPACNKEAIKALAGKDEVFVSKEDAGHLFQILEERGRDREAIRKMGEQAFIKAYWDARLFGNTFLESIKEDKDAKPEDFKHLINTGAVQVGVGLSVARIRVVRMTNTNKSGVQEGKDRGMAPMAFRVVQHGIYCIPIFVNPSVAKKTGATAEDLELFKFLLPYAYQHTSSAIRPQISVLHAWFAEHKNTLGSCPEHLFIGALTPKVKDPDKEPTSTDDYDIPGDDALGDLKSKFKEVRDLAND